MGLKQPIYALIVGIPSQRKIIEKHCFGDCGKIICGALWDKQVGELGICRNRDCPHLDKQMDEPFGKVKGDPVFIRKLK